MVKQKTPAEPTGALYEDCPPEVPDLGREVPPEVEVPLWRVVLRYSPDALVRAQHPAAAFERYKQRMNIIATIHAPLITRHSETDEWGDPLPAPAPAPIPKREPVLID